MPDKVLSSPLIEFSLIRSTIPSLERETWQIRGNSDTIVDLAKAARSGVAEAVSGLSTKLAGIELHLGAVSSRLGDVADAVGYLTSVVERGFFELTLIGELQLAELRRIAEILSQPVQTKLSELRRRGVARFEVGLLAEAEADMQRVLDLDETDFHAHLHIAHIRLLEGDLSAALTSYGAAERYARSLVSADSFWRAMALLGMARAEHLSGDLVAAIDHSDNSIGIIPQRADAHFDRAVYLIAAGRGQEAVEAMATVLRLNPLTGWVLLQMEGSITTELMDRASARATVEALEVGEGLRELLSEFRDLYDRAAHHGWTSHRFYPAGSTWGEVRVAEPPQPQTSQVPSDAPFVDVVADNTRLAVELAKVRDLIQVVGGLKGNRFWLDSDPTVDSLLEPWGGPNDQEVARLRELERRVDAQRILIFGPAWTRFVNEKKRLVGKMREAWPRRWDEMNALSEALTDLGRRVRDRLDGPFIAAQSD